MTGTVKFFDAIKGWGFITDTDGKDVFVYHSNIIMDGFRSLDEGDIVSFEVGVGKDGKEQSVNVTPILTKQIVNVALGNEHMHLKKSKDKSNGCTGYFVVDDNNTVQSGDNCLSLVQSAAFAGIDVEGLE